MKRILFYISLMPLVWVVSVLFSACSPESDSIVTDISSAQVESQGVTFTVTANVEWSISQSGN